MPASELEAASPPPPPPPPPPAATPRRAPIERVAVKEPAPATKKPEVKKPEPKKKPEPAKPDPAKTDPARWWAQVAGGARAADLPKEWAKLVAKAPAAFRGKGAWTTPLRATNRLLAGPFKTSGEAQAFVNLIAKEGLSGFAWQSEAGQKIEKLAVK